MDVPGPVRTTGGTALTGLMRPPMSLTVSVIIMAAGVSVPDSGSDKNFDGRMKHAATRRDKSQRALHFSPGLGG